MPFVFLVIGVFAVMGMFGIVLNLIVTESFKWVLSRLDM